MDDTTLLTQLVEPLVATDPRHAELVQARIESLVRFRPFIQELGSVTSYDLHIMLRMAYAPLGLGSPHIIPLWFTRLCDRVHNLITLILDLEDETCFVEMTQLKSFVDDVLQDTPVSESRAPREIVIAAAAILFLVCTKWLGHDWLRRSTAEGEAKTSETIKEHNGLNDLTNEMLLGNSTTLPSFIEHGTSTTGDEAGDDRLIETLRFADTALGPILGVSLEEVESWSREASRIPELVRPRLQELGQVVAELREAMEGQEVRQWLQTGMGELEGDSPIEVIMRGNGREVLEALFIGRLQSVLEEWKESACEDIDSLRARIRVEVENNIRLTPSVRREIADRFLMDQEKHWVSERRREQPIDVFLSRCLMDPELEKELRGPRAAGLAIIRTALLVGSQVFKMHLFGHGPIEETRFRIDWSDNDGCCFLVRGASTTLLFRSLIQEMTNKLSTIANFPTNLSKGLARQITVELKSGRIQLPGLFRSGQSGADVHWLEWYPPTKESA